MVTTFSDDVLQDDTLPQSWDTTEWSDDQYDDANFERLAREVDEAQLIGPSVVPVVSSLAYDFGAGRYTCEGVT